MLLRVGACAVGFAKAEPIGSDFVEYYRGWIAGGHNGSMEYLSKYDDIRFDPRQLLEGANTVISMAFPYQPSGNYHHSCIADYALGKDYHYVLRNRLQPVVERICSGYGASSRVCVDTAPIPERYWAVRAGIGFVGRNRQLIVPGIGSEVFLCEIITTLDLPADETCRLSCQDCGACIKACPGGALSGDIFDARKCLSYLSIEHRGELPGNVKFSTKIYGCDICQHVCPHNCCETIDPLEEFIPDERIVALSAEDFENLTTSGYRKLVAQSAMKRAPLSQILRNLEKLTKFNRGG